MISNDELSAENIRTLLIELGTRLAAEGIHGDIRLVGGAAIILAGDERRVTVDIDASYSPKEDVDRIAGDMAAAYGLPPGWLNDRAKAFIPDGAQWLKVEMGGLQTERASDETLLAMKLAAERDKDTEDIGFLATKLGLGTPQEIVDLAFELYGEESVPLSSSRDNYLIVAQEGMNSARRIRPALPAGRAGEIWVEPHSRRGKPVDGYWRQSPRHQ